MNRPSIAVKRRQARRRTRPSRSATQEEPNRKARRSACGGGRRRVAPSTAWAGRLRLGVLLARGGLGRDGGAGGRRPLRLGGRAAAVASASLVFFAPAWRSASARSFGSVIFSSGGSVRAPPRPWPRSPRPAWRPPASRPPGRRAVAPPPGRRPASPSASAAGPSDGAGAGTARGPASRSGSASAAGSLSTGGTARASPSPPARPGPRRPGRRPASPSASAAGPGRRASGTSAAGGGRGRNRFGRGLDRRRLRGLGRRALPTPGSRPRASPALPDARPPGCLSRSVVQPSVSSASREPGPLGEGLCWRPPSIGDHYHQAKVMPLIRDRI